MFKIKSVVITLVGSLLVVGCYKPAQESARAGNDILVEKLFTHEGCTVYRFYDAGNKYFTNCKGTAEWIESCGKNCSNQEQVVGQQGFKIKENQ